jgi:Ca2+-binding RTX toxin-like protein
MSGGVASTYTPATGVWTASGAIANVNILLAGLTFTPALNFNGNFTVTTSVSDGVTAPATGSKAFTGIAVNDAPVNAAPGAQSTNEDTALVFSGGNANLISVGDVDAASLQVALSVAHGTLTLSQTTGLTISAGANGTGSMTVTGTKADLNAALAGLSYLPASNYNGADTLALTTSDLGATGSGGTLTDTDSVAITVTAVNDAPTGAVSVTGTAALGQMLTANTAALADVDGLGTLHYTWLRSGVAIAGAADASTYTTALADVGASLSVRVSYTDGGSTAESVLSSSTATVGVMLTPPPGLPVRSGVGASGTSGAEALIGGAGNDKLLALGGNDWLDGAGGTNYMLGGTGNDTYMVRSLSDVIMENANEGTDTAIASINYTLGSNVEWLFQGGTAHLSGTGNALSNLIVGNAGNNRLNGMGGNDTLIGGDGQDVFVFNTTPGAGNNDTLQNFIVADDTIELNRSAFPALSAGPLAAGAFVTGAAALDAGDRILYNSATGALLYDADGTGATAAVQFATLVGVVGVLTEADFVVV